MASHLEDSWLSDDALTELDDELFDRAHLVSRVLEVLARVREQSASSTIGLVGAWGSGKSSVLNGLVKSLRAADEATSKTMGQAWRVADFNPWLFTSPQALYTGFFSALRNSLPEAQQWSSAREDFIKVGRKFAPVAALAGLVGIDGQAAAEKVLDAMAIDVVESRDKIAAELKKLGQPILIVVDDLDRLTAAELLHVFKLVRLVGRLPNVYYLLSYDEHTLIDLLSHTDLVTAGDERRALDYLEKIVQVRVDMPLLRPFEVDRIVERAVTHLSSRHRVSLTEQELSAIIRRFDEVLSKRLRTPRALKRVFGQVDAFLGSVGAEVDFSDYLVVTWLRTIEPGVYLLIQQRRAELLRTSNYSLRSVHAPKHDGPALKKQWLQALQDSHVDEAHLEDVLWLLGTLFDVIAHVYRSEAPGDYSATQPSSGKIQHPDYFDRYFAFGVPSDDLPDAVAETALSNITAGLENTEAVNRVLRTFNTQPDLVLRKISSAVDAAQRLSVNVATWLADRWMKTNKRHTKDRIENLAVTALTKLSADEVEQFAGAMLSSDRGLHFIAALEYLLSVDSYGPEELLKSREDAARVLAPLLSHRFIERYGELLSEHRSPLDLPAAANDAVWYWRYRDPVTLKSFLMRSIAHGWSALDTMAWMVPASTSDGETFFIGPRTDVGHFRELFDLDAIAATLEPDLSEAALLGSLPNMPAEPETRRKVALAGLKGLRLADQQRTPDATPELT